MPELIGMHGFSLITTTAASRSDHGLRQLFCEEPGFSGATFDTAPFSPVCCKRFLALATKTHRDATSAGCAVV
ncbi:hypothetical protein J2W42_004836 [Rhizobium tibeticum]|nr:hypothetical protein [Rhizobium tibeticum]